MDGLKQAANQRQKKLDDAREIQLFYRDADDTIAWISEKDNMLSTEDFGHDLVSVEELQKKHRALETDLDAYAKVRGRMFRRKPIGMVSLTSFCSCAPNGFLLYLGFNGHREQYHFTLFSIQ